MISVKAAERKAAYLRESGVIFPIPFIQACKYRDVGKQTVLRWIDMGLVLNPPKEPNYWDFVLEQLVKDKQFHSERLKAIDAKIKEVRPKSMLKKY